MDLDFQNELIEFSKNKFGYKTVKEMAKAALTVYMAYDGIVSAALLINDPDTFDFEITASIPENYPFANVYDFLVEEGIIGKVLNGLDIITNTNNQWDAQLIIVPLISHSGIAGLVVLDTAKAPSDYSYEYMMLLTLFSSLLASSFAEILAEQKTKEKSDLLEQLVAMRTMHLEEKTKDLNDRLSTLTSNLMSSLPHEVRTPINQILGFTKYLKSIVPDDNSSDDNDLNEIINDIEDSASRLKHLFENYLFHTNLVLISMNINEIENMQKKMTYSAESVIYETIMNMAYNFKRESDLKINLMDSPIAMHETFLVKICEELISNALKFSSNGQIIEVNSFIEAEKYILIIKDYGEGMPNFDIADIGAYIQFNREKNEQQGLGLGLSIVNRIMSIYKAKWDVKSVVGDFTEVMLTLPLPTAEQIEAFENSIG